MRNALRVMISTRQGRLAMIADTAGLLAIFALAYGALYLPSSF